MTGRRSKSARPEAPAPDERVTLHPLTFEEALEALINTPPDEEGDDGES